MNPKTLNDYELKSKKVLVRADLNVPMDKGKISDTSRIERLVPTIRKIFKSMLQKKFSYIKNIRLTMLQKLILVAKYQKWTLC